MPSNIIQINHSASLTWIVPDSKMDEIIKLLNKSGEKKKLKVSQTSPLPCSQSEDQS